MQVQAFEGYWENEQFYPLGQIIRKPGRSKVILTFIGEPVTESKPTSEFVLSGEMPEGFEGLVEKVGLEEAQRRVAWLKRLEEASEQAKDAPPFELPPRAGGMRPPVLFED